MSSSPAATCPDSRPEGLLPRGRPGFDEAGTAVRNAVAQCEDTYFQLAASIWPLIGLEAQLESPIVRDEVARQVRDAQAIAAWGGSVPAQSLVTLRQAAHADGEVLVMLIRSSAVTRPSPCAAPVTSATLGSGRRWSRVVSATAPAAGQPGLARGHQITALILVTARTPARLEHIFYLSLEPSLSGGA